MSWKEELAKLFLYDTDKGKTKPDGSPATKEGEGNYSLDPRKIAAMLGFGLSATGALAPKDPPVGYQGTVPKYNFVRDRVQNTYDPNRRPGSGGQRYFSTPQFVKQTDNMTGEQIGTYEDDLKAAQDAAATEVGGLETLNRENLASYPAPVLFTTTPEETNTGIASLPSIPTAEQQLAGQVNLGMANGGIVGLSHGGFHLTQPSTWGSAASNLGSNIKNTVSSIFSGNDNSSSASKPFFTDSELTNIQNTYSNPTSMEEAEAYRMAGGTDTGHGNILSLSDWKTTLTGGDPGNQYLRNYDLFNSSSQNLRPDGTSKDRDIHDVNYNTEYSKAVASLGNSAINKHARATSFMGGSDYDTTKAAAESGADIDMGVYNNELVGMPVTTNFHGIPITQTVVGYNDENGVFRAVLPDDAKTALAQGNVTMLNNAQEMDAYRNPTASTDDSVAGQVTDITGGDDSAVVNTGDDSAVVNTGDDDSAVVNTGDDSSGAAPITNFSEFLTSIDTGLDSYTGDATTKYSGLSENVTNFASTTGTDLSPTVVTTEILPLTEHYTGLTTAKKETFRNLLSSGDVVTNVTDPETGEVTSVAIPQNKLKAYLDWIQYLESLDTTLIEELKQDLTLLRDFTGASGATGVSGAAYGGAIKGYAMGGMGEPPQGLSASPGLPAGLLKSTEDGMADTIPAQMGDQPINLSGGEYIMDAETVAFLGNGNTDAGAQKLDNFRENLRMAKNGGEDQGNQINSENFLSRLQQAGVA